MQDLSPLFTSQTHSASRFSSLYIVLVALGVLLWGTQCTVKGVEGEGGQGSAGAPCAVWGTYACSPEGDTELFCVEGWYEETQPCPGGCEVTAPTEGQMLLFCYDENGVGKP